MSASDEGDVNSNWHWKGQTRISRWLLGTNPVSDPENLVFYIFTPPFHVLVKYCSCKHEHSNVICSSLNRMRLHSCNYKICVLNYAKLTEPKNNRNILNSNNFLKNKTNKIHYFLYISE